MINVFLLIVAVVAGTVTAVALFIVGRPSGVDDNDDNENVVSRLSVAEKQREHRPLASNWGRNPESG